MKRLTLTLSALLLALSLWLTACGTVLPGADALTDAAFPTSETVGHTGIDGPVLPDSTDTRIPSDTHVSTGETVPPIPGHDAHTDADDNGLCDVCAISVITYINFFAINDLHGKFCDTDRQPGVDELTTYLKTAYATEEAVILLSSGDMWQGSSESNLTKGLIVTEWMNELDFVSMTLGNHEFDWGETYMEENAEVAEFPFLAINVYDRETDKLADYCTPSVLVERGDATIGIIGAIGDCYSSISGETSGGVYFKVGAELTALVKAESQRLRAAGADFIVYSLHDGYDDSRSGGFLTDAQLSTYYDTALSEGYVDLVFEGHTHQTYALVDDDGVYHLQNGGENKGIAHVELKLNTANGNHHVDRAEIVVSSVYERMDDHPIVDELMDKYKDQVSLGTEVLGTNARRLSSDAIREIIAKLYFEAGFEMWGEDYDIVLGGGFMSVRAPYELAAGEVRYADLQSLLPFDNTLVLCSVKGSDLKSKFIYTSNKNYFNYYGSYGQSVKDRIDPAATYYIIVDTYTSTYGPNRLTEVARYEADVYARDLLADYIREGGLAG